MIAGTALVRGAAIWAVALLTAVACARGAEPTPAADVPATTTPAESQAPALKVIDHVAPPRDSVGKSPSRFEWTAVAGADRYAIGIWNEVDQLIWRRDDVTGTSTTIPDGFTFDPGTYFWAVVALQDGRAIGDSGRSAFVVRD